MTIERVMGGFTGFDLECDECEETRYLNWDWEDFNSAVAEAKALGWKAHKDHYGNWNHLCPNCAEKEIKP